MVTTRGWGYHGNNKEDGVTMVTTRWEGLPITIVTGEKELPR